MRVSLKAFSEILFESVWKGYWFEKKLIKIQTIISSYISISIHFMMINVNIYLETVIQFVNNRRCRVIINKLATSNWFNYITMINLNSTNTYIFVSFLLNCVKNIAWEQHFDFLLVYAIPKNIKSSLAATPDNFDNRLLANITNKTKTTRNTNVYQRNCHEQTNYLQPAVIGVGFFIPGSWIPLLQGKMPFLSFPLLFGPTHVSSTFITNFLYTSKPQSVKYVNCENEN